MIRCCLQWFVVQRYQSTHESLQLYHVISISCYDYIILHPCLYSTACLSCNSSLFLDFEGKNRSVLLKTQAKQLSSISKTSHLSWLLKSSPKCFVNSPWPHGTSFPGDHMWHPVLPASRRAPAALAAWPGLRRTGTRLIPQCQCMSIQIENLLKARMEFAHRGL